MVYIFSVIYEDADSCLCTVTLFMVYIFSVIYEDADSCLCTVTLFKRAEDEFRHKCRENR